MLIKDIGIEHKVLDETLFASIRFTLNQRQDVFPALAKLAHGIPAKYISGPPTAIIHFITAVKDGYDFELGYPVVQAVETKEIKTRLLPGMQVLSLIHQGSLQTIRESYARLYAFTSEHALISDEFGREVYLETSDPQNCRIEINFVVHDWQELLNQNVLRVLGEEAQLEVMQDRAVAGLEASTAARFEWTREALERLDGLADERQRYEILSRCAHVFPAEQVARLRAVYRQRMAEQDDPLQGVDALIEFIHQDPVWGVQPYREGRTIFTSKNPRDKQAYAQATTEAERRRAYCFCPIIRENLDGRMPDSFCYCSAGWERRQWEGAIGRPVMIDVVKSILRGDKECQFAIHLPEEMFQ